MSRSSQELDSPAPDGPNDIGEEGLRSGVERAVAGTRGDEGAGWGAPACRQPAVVGGSTAGRGARRAATLLALGTAATGENGSSIERPPMELPDSDRSSAMRAQSVDMDAAARAVRYGAPPSGTIPHRGYGAATDRADNTPKDGRVPWSE